MRVYFRHRSFGLEHVPTDTGAIVATNHASNIDPPLVNVDIPRPLHYMAKQSLLDIPFFGTVITYFNAFPVRRGGADRQALKKAVDLLDDGQLLLMFPEGTRSRDGQLQKPRRGIGKIVLESEAPVIPGYIKGSFNAMAPGDWFPKPFKTETHFGEAVKFSQQVPCDDGEQDQYQWISDRIMKEIKGLKESCDT